ncbi:MAG: hypothetical protein H7Y20_07705 [Bryobacteraceae bacterium]|nr:hypothetical protein [Bryobacteraceae bacterium]
MIPFGWRVMPTGRQIALDSLPLSTAVSSSGRDLFILHSGYKKPSVWLLDGESGNVRQKLDLPDAFLGMALSNSGEVLYISGGSKGVVYSVPVRNGIAGALVSIPIKPNAPDDDGFVGDVLLDERGQKLYVALLFADSIACFNLKTSKIDRWIKTGKRPYRLRLLTETRQLLVTSWGEDKVYLHSLSGDQGADSLVVGAQPADMKVFRTGSRTRIAVAAANTNSIALGEMDKTNQRLRLTETVNVAFSPSAPVGANPGALAFDPERKLLFVACSYLNALAVLDVSGAVTRVLGFIPTGWYPTSVSVLPSGDLLVLNGKGSRSYPNPQGPNPTVHRSMLPQPPTDIQYVSLLQLGSASLIRFTLKDLPQLTRQVLANSPTQSPLSEGTEKAPRPAIEHVVYIMKENRTYDQVLGDLPKGNGDPSLVLFGEGVTPNHHKLANEFVLLDNFYVNADVSADGWPWSTAAYATDYIQKMNPMVYGGRRRGFRETSEPPPGGYLWSKALSAGLAFRNYGFYVNNIEVDKVTPKSGHVQSFEDSALRDHTSLSFRGYDGVFPDVERARVFLKELAEFETKGQYPNLVMIHLGNDHTSGPAPGYLTPQSSMADNDYALGLVVDGLSKSKFWKKMAVFVLEDDAQNGADHVDSHRSLCFVASPFVKKGSVDSGMYNTTSVLRTIGELLGLKPLTQFDATSPSMLRLFSSAADLAPFDVEPPRFSLDKRNPGNIPKAGLWKGFDLTKPDRIDDAAFNRVLWQAVRGTEAPPPRRSFFSNGHNPMEGGR